MRRSFTYNITLAMIAIVFIISVLSFSLGIFQHAKHVENVERFTHKWLSTFSETLMTNIQMGNFISVRKNLKSILDSGGYRQIHLSFGENNIKLDAAPSAISMATSAVGDIMSRFVSSKLDLPLVDQNNTLWGSLSISYDPAVVYQNSFEALELYLVVSLSLLFLGVGLVIYIVERNIRPLQSLMMYIERYKEAEFDRKKIEELEKFSPKLSTIEWSSLLNLFNAAIKNIIRLENKIESTRVEVEKVKLSRQVAHDIRSPLTALELVVDSTSVHFPENVRVIVRSAVDRIRDIAYDLGQNKGKIAESEGERHQTKNTLVLSSLQSIISEKRIEYRDRQEIEIEGAFGPDTYGLFSQIQSAEFKRVISNIINNGVEAMTSKAGRIFVDLRGDTSKVVIRIVDNGKGIPHDIVKKLGRTECTFEKEQGTGLGLLHAGNMIRTWGGELLISSVLGEGTEVKIVLPRTQAPHWFLPNIEIKDGSHVIIVDDDNSIHYTWHQRFNESDLKDRIGRVSSFTSPDEFRQWMRQEDLDLSKCLFLMDFEFIGFECSGVDLIKEFELHECSILVTSRNEEQRILRDCEANKIWLLPKTLARFVPLRKPD